VNNTCLLIYDLIELTVPKMFVSLFTGPRSTARSTDQLIRTKLEADVLTSARPSSDESHETVPALSVLAFDVLSEIRAGERRLHGEWNSQCYTKPSLSCSSNHTIAPSVQVWLVQ
jgi:hypothetical protein